MESHTWKDVFFILRWVPGRRGTRLSQPLVIISQAAAKWYSAHLKTDVDDCVFNSTNDLINTLFGMIREANIL